MVFSVKACEPKLELQSNSLTRTLFSSA